MDIDDSDTKEKDDDAMDVDGDSESKNKEGEDAVGETPTSSGDKKDSEEKETTTDDAMDVGDDDKKKEEEEEDEEEEDETEMSAEEKWARDLEKEAKQSKSYTIMKNPCRVTPHQRSVIETIPGQRYVPVKRVKKKKKMKKKNTNMVAVWCVGFYFFFHQCKKIFILFVGVCWSSVCPPSLSLSHIYIYIHVCRGWLVSSC